MNLMDNSSYSEGTVEHSLELMRKELQKYKNIVGIALAIVGMLWVGSYLFYFQVMSSGMYLYMFGIACVCIMVAAIFWKKASDLKKRYRHLYKQELVVKVLNEEFDNVIYDYNLGFTEREIREMEFVGMGNRFKSEDYLKASYKDVNFIRSDVEVRYVSNGKNKRDVTHFKGRVYELEFNKNISAGMQIRTHNFPYPKKPFYLGKDDKVQTENMGFNKIFDVFATNDMAAFYVLTPHMMERIMRLSSSFKSICINIIGNKMILAANSMLDGLEPPTSVAIDYNKEKKRILGELTEIMAIIEELGLDDKTFAESIYNSLDSRMEEKTVDNRTVENMISGNIG